MPIFGASVEVELNKTGSFKFTMQQDHPRYDLIKKLKGVIKVYQDGDLIFRGRALDDPTGWHNEKKISCEGELSFLLDSQQRPYDYTGTIEGFLNLMITRHNEQVEESKWFTVGQVTVTDPNDYIVRSNIDYVDTWTEIEDKLIKLLGGYIIIRHEGYINYIDYLADVTLLSPQKIEFGKNLLDLERIRKGASIGTALIPLGAKLKDEEGKDTDQRLTIATVNDGSDMIRDEAAISQYGTIVKRAYFDDITEPENLLIKGRAHLAGLVKLPDTIELTAADLSTAGQDIAAFHLGTYVRAISRPHGIDQLFLITKLSVNLSSPGASKITLGAARSGLSSSVAGLTNTQGEILKEIEKTAQAASQAVYDVEQNVQASIQMSEENILSSVSESYTLKDDTDALISSISTTVEQTKESVEIQFSQFSQDIEAVAAGTDANFEEIRKYIRFVDGQIHIGEVGNELELRIANDRLSFLQDGAEVAYLSNRKLYITDTQILHSLQLGSFAFMPRANGNLSFKKI
jgi:hypothetical protein